MDKYFAAYKCQLCGKIMTYGEPVSVPHDKLPELCAMVVRNQAVSGNPVLHEAPMHMVHNCVGKNCGLATFAGFVREV